jgi:uncharacterized membrane protein YoaK (UPF0700 family)
MPSPAAPRPAGWPQRRVLLIGLTGAAGWLDALAWIFLGKVFLSFMSGNLLFLGIASGQGNWGLFGRALVALAAFLLGAVAGGRLAGSHLDPREEDPPMSRTLLFQAGLLTVFAVVWLIGGSPVGDTGLTYALIVIGALAMGIQAAVSIAFHVPNVATVAMTGTLAQFAALVGWREREGSRAGLRDAPPASLMVLLILAYLVAAILVATGPDSAWMAFGPAVLIVGALVIDDRVRTAEVPGSSRSVVSAPGASG